MSSYDLLFLSLGSALETIACNKQWIIFLASFKSTLHFFRALPICRGFSPKDCKVLLGSYEGCHFFYKNYHYFQRAKKNADPIDFLQTLIKRL